MSDQSALDADLQALAAAVDQLVSTYQQASAKASAAGVDLSAEDAQVQQLTDRITGAINTPAAPVVPNPGVQPTAIPDPNVPTPAPDLPPFGTLPGDPAPEADPSAQSTPSAPAVEGDTPGQ